jgi:ATP-dependent DNA helicase RecG
MICRNRLNLSMKLSSKPKVAFTNKNAWLSPVSSLKGVGAKTEEILNQIDISTIADVLFHFPVGVIDRRTRTVLSAASPGAVITVDLRVKSATKGFNGTPHSVISEDLEGTLLEVKYFYAPQMAHYIWGTISEDFIVNSSVIVSGKLGRSKYTNNLEIINPDVVVSAKESKKVLESKLGLELVYGLTKGLTITKIRTLVESSLQTVVNDKENGGLVKKGNTDWMISDEREKRNWPTTVDALRSIHHAKNEEDILPNSHARRRLAFDDFVSQFLHQMDKQAQQKLMYIEKYNKNMEKKMAAKGYQHNEFQFDKFSVAGSGLYSSVLLRNLPFNLTVCQRNAVREINEEIAGDHKMNRLLQGDVGSGKTLVAILSILGVMESNRQGAIVAPTALLASQHYKVISQYFEGISNSFPHLTNTDDSYRKVINGTINDNSNFNNIDHYPNRRLRVELLTSNVKGKAREKIFSDTKKGLVDLIVGTHALLNDDVLDCFPSLGLVVIDEEQRFGVEQREVISCRANTIYMTATPIPRSLFILSQDETKISTLIEKPPLKRKVLTIVRPSHTVQQIIERIKYHIEYGTKVFWVSPSLMANKKDPKGDSVMER